MADDAATAWPIPKFRFQVEWPGIGDGKPSFQEVTGLDVEAQPIEYRSGDSKVASVIKLPGLKKYGNVTMKKGVFAKDNNFFTWLSEAKVKRISITIKLLDEEGNPTMVWTLTNAWPTKISGTDLKAEGSEVAVESIEIAHEGLTVANG